MAKWFMPIVRDSIVGWQLGHLVANAGESIIHGPFDSNEQLREKVSRIIPKGTKGIVLEGDLLTLE